MVYEHIRKESSRRPIVASSRTGFASNLTGRVSRLVGWGKPVNIVYLNFRKAIKVPPDLFWLRW